MLPPKKTKCVPNLQERSRKIPIKNASRAAADQLQADLESLVLSPLLEQSVTEQMLSS